MSEELERYISETIFNFPNLEKDLQERVDDETEGIASFGTRICAENKEFRKRRDEELWKRAEESQNGTGEPHKMTEQTEEPVSVAVPSARDYEQLYRRVGGYQRFFEEFDKNSVETEERSSSGVSMDTTLEVQMRRNENESPLNEMRGLRNIPEEHRWVLGLKNKILSKHSSHWETEHFRFSCNRGCGRFFKACMFPLYNLLENFDNRKCKWCSLEDESYGWAPFDIHKHIQCNYVKSGEDGRTCNRDPSTAYSKILSTPTTTRSPEWEAMTATSLPLNGQTLLPPLQDLGPQQHASLPITPPNKPSNGLGRQKNGSLSPEAPSFVPHTPLPPIHLDPRLQSYHEGCHFVPPPGPSTWQGQRQYGNGRGRGGFNNSGWNNALGGMQAQTQYDIGQGMGANNEGWNGRTGGRGNYVGREAVGFSRNFREPFMSTKRGRKEARLLYGR